MSIYSPKSYTLEFNYKAESEPKPLKSCWNIPLESMNPVYSKCREPVLTR